jgi:hypothetical protein
MGVFSSNQKVTVPIEADLMEKINIRLRRDLNISELMRWFIRSIVLSEKEMEAYCREHEEEARRFQDILQPALKRFLKTDGETKHKKQRGYV